MHFIPLILTKKWLVFWEIWRRQKDISKLSDLFRAYCPKIYCVCGARICYKFWHGHETRRVETGKRCKICTQWRMQEEKLHNNNTATMKNPLHSFPPFVYSEYWSTLEHSLVSILAWHTYLVQFKLSKKAVDISNHLGLLRKPELDIELNWVLRRHFTKHISSQRVSCRHF